MEKLMRRNFVVQHYGGSTQGPHYQVTDTHCSQVVMGGLTERQAHSMVTRLNDVIETFILDNGLDPAAAKKLEEARALVRGSAPAPEYYPLCDGVDCKHEPYTCPNNEPEPDIDIDDDGYRDVPDDADDPYGHFPISAQEEYGFDYPFEVRH